MAAIKKFSEVLKNSSGIVLAFVDLMQDEAQTDGSTIVRLVLDKPIPFVPGGKRTDRVTGESIRLEASMVEIINIGAESIAALDEMADAGQDPFNWKVEGKSGTLKCNLKLDVSGALEVWLVKTSLSQFGRKQRDNQRSKSNERIAAMIAEAKAKRELAGADITVDAETVGEEV